MLSKFVFRLDKSAHAVAIFLVLLLPASFPHITSRQQQKPCSYIFYWGVLQAKFQQNDSTGEYFSELHTSKAEFQEAVKREPRLWDGQALAPQCSFSIDSIIVRSDYFDGNVYGSVRQNLLDMAAQLSDSAQIKISNLALPGGKTGEVFVFFTQSAPNWLRTVAPQRVSVDVKTPFTLQWGPEKFDAKAREFFTVDEFWNIIRSEPLFYFDDGHVTRPDQWNVTLRSKSGAKEFWKNDESETSMPSLQDMRNWLNGKNNEIQPGTHLYFYSWDTSIHREVIGYDTIFPLPGSTPLREPRTFARLSDGIVIPTAQLNQIQVAELSIVPDDDPRLSLRLSDRKNFHFSWGSYQYDIHKVYAQSYFTAEGSVARAQSGFTTHTNNLNRTQILDMVRKPAKIEDDKGALLDPPTFTLRYKNHTATATDGICPADFVQILETELQPYESLVIGEIRAGASDLGFAEFVFEVRNEDPKALLRPSFAPLDAPVEQQLRLMPIPPQSTNGQVGIQFFLPVKGEASFTLHAGPGEVLWTHSGVFSKGRNQLNIPVSEIKTEKWMVLTLESAGLKVEQQFLIAL